MGNYGPVPKSYGTIPKFMEFLFSLFVCLFGVLRSTQNKLSYGDIIITGEDYKELGSRTAKLALSICLKINMIELNI